MFKRSTAFLFGGSIVATSEVLTMSQVANQFRCQAWQIGKLIKRGKIPEPRRVGKIALFQPGDVPRIEKALREAGYLK